MESLHKKWMELALSEASSAAKMGEVPVGAVIVRNGEVIATAHNLCEANHAATAHAELLAIEQACNKLGSWRLSDCTLYVTLEPCPMCAGAIINARIPKIVFGAKDPRAGACGSLINLPAYPLESRPDVESGIMELEAQALLRSFFEEMRKKKQ